MRRTLLAIVSTAAVAVTVAGDLNYALSPSLEKQFRISLVSSFESFVWATQRACCVRATSDAWVARRGGVETPDRSAPFYDLPEAEIADALSVGRRWYAATSVGHGVVLVRETLHEVDNRTTSEPLLPTG